MRAPAVPLLLDAEPGQRFCLFHRADPEVPFKGAVVYVHPFAEEMNKSRRMAALQARAFAAAGMDVLQVDLYGCGDSDGDFVDTRWHIWRRDVLLARAWLLQHGDKPIYYWGLRLGALLALDAAVHAPPAGLILWHPLLQGDLAVRQFLRLRLAADLRDGGQRSSALRQQLDACGAIEVAGYELSLAMVREIEQRDARAMALPGCPIDCFWINSEPAGAGLLLACGHPQQVQTVSGPSFWSTTEVAVCPELIAATLSAMSPVPA